MCTTIRGERYKYIRWYKLQGRNFLGISICQCFSILGVSVCLQAFARRISRVFQWRSIVQRYQEKRVLNPMEAFSREPWTDTKSSINKSYEFINFYLIHRHFFTLIYFNCHISILLISLNALYQLCSSELKTENSYIALFAFVLLWNLIQWRYFRLCSLLWGWYEIFLWINEGKFYDGEFKVLFLSTSWRRVWKVFRKAGFAERVRSF